MCGAGSGSSISAKVTGFSAFGSRQPRWGAPQVFPESCVDGKFTVNPKAEWAGGGFASTAEDLARWAKALYEGGLIKQPYFDQMLAGIDTGERDKYGLGVEIGEGRWGKVL